MRAAEKTGPKLQKLTELLAGKAYLLIIIQDNPDPDCMEFLATRKVMTLGTDSASMGPLPNLAEPTHYAGLKHGMIWTEGATSLGKLPPTGAFYTMLGPKHKTVPTAKAARFPLSVENCPRD